MTDKTDAIWMPLYVDKYLGDTTHLTTEQHGAYLLLLMTAWKRNGILPLQEQQLQQIARLSPAAWRKHRDVLLAFFTETEAGYQQKRLTEEFEKASRIIETKRENGKKGGRPRKENLEETGRLSETKPTGKATDNRQGNRGETQSQLQTPKPPLRSELGANGDDGTPDSARVGAVAVDAWQPLPQTYRDFEFAAHIPSEFVETTLMEFRAHWRTTGQLRDDWEAKFIQRVTDQWERRQRLRSNP